MSDVQSIMFLIVSAALAGLGGYFTRRVQKYEDTKDEVNLKILPALHYCLLLFANSIATYKEIGDFCDFHTKIQTVTCRLRERIESGEVILTKVELQRIMKFYWDLEKFRVDIEQIKDDKIRQRDLADAISEGNSKYKHWLTRDPLILSTEAKNIDAIIAGKIKRYRLFSITVITLILLTALVLGIAGYINLVGTESGS